MHFSKTYAQLLLDLPPDLRDNAVQYRELKKVINQIVGELSSLGLQPALLQELIAPPPSTTPTTQGDGGSATDVSASSTGVEADVVIDVHTDAPLHLDGRTRVVYELNAESGRIEPQLRISVTVPRGRPPTPLRSDSESEVHGEGHETVAGEGTGAEQDASADELPAEAGESGRGHTSLLYAFQQMQFEPDVPTGAAIVEDVSISKSDPPSKRPASLAITDSDSICSPAVAAAAADADVDTGAAREIVIPLVHDTKFYALLSTTLESIAAQLGVIHADFVRSLQDLSRAIADTAQPASVAANFHPLSSVTTNAGAVRVKTGDLKSDLYSWREIFQIYLEAEVFESVGEASRGERSVEESERRLQLFAERVTRNGLGDRRQFKLKQSVQALETFLSLNLFILNIKKFSHANSEATRKILKKHTKRTALFFPGLSPGSTPPSSAPPPLRALAARTHPFSLPRLLVQALGDTLLPIVPSVEDYACLICTALAFKPIRLRCGHLFCVRCLVKMQKRHTAQCPMCRAPSVLVANRTNVDWALLNFMQDWFPIEAKEKLKANEREASEEELRELGIDPDQSCVVM
ncbi:hypothetical protein HYPSUDRAFT_87754 [Hypholoma sublateritium FD-334 SS-4]|uniref:RING-type domain-containing protein n=1 Tax=Hypholoma sublateritium (strain FD-334 SS-4) TaxID=945553 RepID=A0A0D2PPF1_HYPSF|nr:hypothetical protein HYPSUDRAFT_87754 [Hypholoma sublateritium FD-334 SS-4]